MNPHGRVVGVAFGSLLASSATLICCVLPAVLVSIGAGAALVGLVSAFPQLVWLSEHKVVVFMVAAVLLAGSGFMIWRARRLPCPADPVAARSCTTLRRVSAVLYGVSVTAFAIGAAFAFVLPRLLID
jgi:Na+/melibiose symporter-like transporter